jgi:NarL family two-component system response regulator LiaR
MSSADSSPSFEAPKKIRVLLVDDHSLVRQGLRMFIEMQSDMQVVGEGADGLEAVELAARLQPDVILLDLLMPHMDGLQATCQILAANPQARVLILTSFGEDDQIFPAIRAGAQGYLLKDIQPGELVQAIRETYQGKAQLHPQVARRLMQAVSGEAPPRPATSARLPQALQELTERERQVLDCIARGLTNRQIAEKMVISEKTVKTHVSNLLDKLGLEDRTRAAIWALIAVLARAAGWSQDAWPIPQRVWLLLALYGLLLFSEQALTRRLRWYPYLYIAVQSVLVVAMLYLAPGLDIIAMLFYPLSFQAVWYFPGLSGFLWIGAYILAMLGLFTVGLEADPGVAMVVGSGGASLLMGSFARLMRRTEQQQAENQRMFSDLQGAYRRLKDSAAQSEALAAAEERHRLVRELHDSLTQTLFSMNLAVQSAQLSTGDGPTQVDEHLLRLQSLARNAAAEVQALTGQSSPPPPAQGSLAGALQRLADERRSQDGLLVSLETSGQRAFPESVQANLYRIAQEALNNVSRHAGVQAASVRLCLDGPIASLEIRDLGCGFEALQRERSGGFGLRGMHERAAEIGWELAVESLPGRGTTVRVQEKTV